MGAEARKGHRPTFVQEVWAHVQEVVIVVAVFFCMMVVVAPVPAMFPGPGRWSAHYLPPGAGAMQVPRAAALAAAAVSPGGPQHMEECSFNAGAGGKAPPRWRMREAPAHPHAKPDAAGAWGAAGERRRSLTLFCHRRFSHHSQPLPRRETCGAAS